MVSWIKEKKLMENQTPSNSELFRAIIEIKQMYKEHWDISSRWHDDNSAKLNDLNTKSAVAN